MHISSRGKINVINVHLFLYVCSGQTQNESFIIVIICHVFFLSLSRRTSPSTGRGE